MSTAQPTLQPPALPLQKPPGYRDPTIPIHHAPPRKPVNLPPSFRPRRSCCRTFCCCFCITGAALILVSISAGGFLYLWFQPHLPEIHLKSFNFTKFNVSTTPDGTVLNAESTIGVEIKNPNQNMEMVYDRTRFSLNAVNGYVNLGQQTVPGFTQGKNSVRTLRSSTKVQNEIVDNDAAEELSKGFRSKNLLVNAEMRSGIGMKVGGWNTGTVQVKVLCLRMRLSQVQNGDMMPQCSIQMLNWFYIN